MKKTIAAIVALAATLSMTPGLSAAEEAAPKKGPFAVADANGDGKLDPAEFAQMVSKRMDATKAQARFKQLDKNGDGFVSRKEHNMGTEAAKKGAEKAKAEKAKEGKTAKKPEAAPN